MYWHDYNQLKTMLFVKPVFLSVPSFLPPPTTPLCAVSLRRRSMRTTPGQRPPSRSAKFSTISIFRACPCGPAFVCSTASRLCLALQSLFWHSGVRKQITILLIRMELHQLWSRILREQLFSIPIPIRFNFVQTKSDFQKFGFFNPFS